jgi:hypothetical protein
MPRYAKSEGSRRFDPLFAGFAHALRQSIEGFVRE